MVQPISYTTTSICPLVECLSTYSGREASACCCSIHWGTRRAEPWPPFRGWNANGQSGDDKTCRDRRLGGDQEVIREMAAGIIRQSSFSTARHACISAWARPLIVGIRLNGGRGPAAGPHLGWSLVRSHQKLEPYVWGSSEFYICERTGPTHRACA